ncbi:MAG: YidB family protein [Methylomonas lenta]|nr:YidB family protein [Methylomonas lenta]
MNSNDLMQMGAQLFKSQLDNNRDGNVDITEISSALNSLFSAGQSQTNTGAGGLAGIISGMQSSGNSDLLSLAASWLGSGANKPVSGNQLEQIFGQDKISAFSQQLGISQEQALSGLQATVPDVVDKASPSGNIDLNAMLDSIGGIQGALNMAGKFFAK